MSSKFYSNWLEGVWIYNQERGLIERGFNPLTELHMLKEELHEFEVGSTEEEYIDALADVIVLATGAMFKLGYRPNCVMNEVVREIMSRTGSINPTTGKWEKDENQNGYKADFKKCKQTKNDGELTQV